MISKEQLEEFKRIYKKEYGKEISDKEATEAAHNLLGFVETLFELHIKELKRKARLKKEPKGFHLTDGTYSCCICGDSITGENSWYDKNGMKCLNCQKAIDKKKIPAFVAKNKESWYSKYDIESRFDINRHALNRFVKQGILKPRIIPRSNGKPHFYVFMIKDNKDTLPPKELTESQLVKKTIDGKDWYHSEPWYKFVDDPHKALKGYKIMDYLKVVHEEKN